MDIYKDIDVLGVHYDKVEEENVELNAHIKSLEADIDKLCNEIKSMKAKQDQLTRNISELFNTAKCEIQRKDRTIAELRKQLEETQSKQFFKYNQRPYEHANKPFPLSKNEGNQQKSVTEEKIKEVNSEPHQRKDRTIAELRKQLEETQSKQFFKYNQRPYEHANKPFPLSKNEGNQQKSVTEEKIKEVNSVPHQQKPGLPENAGTQDRVRHNSGSHHSKNGTHNRRRSKSPHKRRRSRSRSPRVHRRRSKSLKRNRRHSPPVHKSQSPHSNRNHHHNNAARNGDHHKSEKHHNSKDLPVNNHQRHAQKMDVAVNSESKLNVSKEEELSLKREHCNAPKKAEPVECELRLNAFKDVNRQHSKALIKEEVPKNEPKPNVDKRECSPIVRQDLKPECSPIVRQGTKPECSPIVRQDTKPECSPIVRQDIKPESERINACDTETAVNASANLNNSENTSANESVLTENKPFPILKPTNKPLRNRRKFCKVRIS